MGWKAAVPWAFFYGGPLAVGCFIAAGGGHGVGVALGIGASPITVIPDAGWALLAIPFIWGAAGGLAASSEHRVERYAFRANMLLHYAALPFILTDQEQFGDWHSVRREPGAFAMCIGIYAIGQVVLWTVHLKACRCCGCGTKRRPKRAVGRA